jgi:hypothetical protein
MFGDDEVEEKFLSRKEIVVKEGVTYKRMTTSSNSVELKYIKIFL